MTQEIMAPSLGTDHPSVKGIIKLANEILSEGRVLNIEYLYRRAKRELKIPREGLNAIIQYLINKKILIDGSKFTRETILDNEIRNFIYGYIQDNIGLHFSKIKREIIKNLSSNQIGTGQLIWHLEMLQKFNMIKNFTISNHTIFIPIDFDEKLAKIYYFARNVVRNKIFRYLILYKHGTRSQLCENIDENRENIYYHIKILVENNYIMDLDGDLTLNSKSEYYIINVIQSLSQKNKINYKNT